MALPLVPFPVPVRAGRLELRYLRAPKPLFFPESAEVPEGKQHGIVRAFLFALLRHALGAQHSVGSDQFVYWNAREPKRCLSPDVFVKLGIADLMFGSWKTWERGGPPDMAVEIVSPSEGDGIAWDEKLGRYHELGVKELVRFDPEGPNGQRLRAWDRVREDLVERKVEGERTPCILLGVDWLVAPVEGSLEGLRLAYDDGRLVPSEAEAQKARADAAEERIRALEAELAKRG